MLVLITLPMLLLEVMGRMFEHFYFRVYFSTLFHTEVLSNLSKASGACFLHAQTNLFVFY